MIYLLKSIGNNRLICIVEAGQKRAYSVSERFTETEL